MYMYVCVCGGGGITSGKQLALGLGTKLFEWGGRVCKRACIPTEHTVWLGTIDLLVASLNMANTWGNTAQQFAVSSR